MSIGILKPGIRVKSVIQHRQHDHWEGIVVEIETHERVTWTSRLAWVRWCKPDGDPSEDMTGHDPSELMPFEPRESSP
jgi:hypothetical protein